MSPVPCMANAKRKRKYNYINLAQLSHNDNAVTIYRLKMWNTGMSRNLFYLNGGSTWLWWWDTSRKHVYTAFGCRCYVLLSSFSLDLNHRYPNTGKYNEHCAIWKWAMKNLAGPSKCERHRKMTK